MLRGVYANPEKELVRLRNTGLVVKIGPGTYTAKPDTVPTDQPWRPAFEEAAMAYATAQFGNRIPVLFGIGAARFHHAIPRAIGATVIAVPHQHRPIFLEGGGRVVFAMTDVGRLDARSERASLGRFLVATPEETLLSLLDRPSLGEMTTEALSAIQALGGMVEPESLAKLASRYSRRAQRDLALLLRDLGPVAESRERPAPSRSSSKRFS
ncbi:MAG TPA: type IV toxin-antitoxin system AbiEi family antitoxin [Propionicimonas sp.]|jgi:hypothetical protein